MLAKGFSGLVTLSPYSGFETVFLEQFSGEAILRLPLFLCGAFPFASMLNTKSESYRSRNAGFGGLSNDAQIKKSRLSDNC